MSAARSTLISLQSAVKRVNAMSIRWAHTASNAILPLQGKTAVVTASTKGIGLAIVERLATDGARVILSSRRQNNVTEAVNTLKQKGLDVSGIVCHVSKTDDRQSLIKHALDKEGKIDILISNAAVNPATGHVLDTSEEVWDKIFDVNVKSAFLLSKEFLPHIRNGGSIVYISSIAGMQLMPLIATYSVTKSTLLALTKAVAHQCAPLNIRVNCVCPGIVKTDFSSLMWNSDEALEYMKSIVPLGRIAEPKEIAGIVSFLCSNDASYITGENIVVGGGMPSRL